MLSISTSWLQKDEHQQKHKHIRYCKQRPKIPKTGFVNYPSLPYRKCFDRDTVGENRKNQDDEHNEIVQATEQRHGIEMAETNSRTKTGDITVGGAIGCAIECAIECAISLDNGAIECAIARNIGWIHLDNDMHWLSLRDINE